MNLTDRSKTHLEELSRRMVAGGDRAYREFADIFGPRFRGYLLKHGLSPSDAEDLAVSCVTDIALKVWKYKSTPDGSFEAWVFTLFRHALADWFKCRQPAQEPLVEESTPADAIEGNTNMEVVFAVGDALAQLAEIDQAIIQLRDFGIKHTYEEISEHLNIQPGTARVRYLRAKKQLECILIEDPRIK